MKEFVFAVGALLAAYFIGKKISKKELEIIDKENELNAIEKIADVKDRICDTIANNDIRSLFDKYIKK